MRCGLIYSFQICRGDIGGGYGEDAIDNDGDTLVTAIAGYLAFNALESAANDTDCSSLVELMLVIGNDDKFAGLVSLDRAEIFQVPVRDDERRMF